MNKLKQIAETCKKVLLWIIAPLLILGGVIFSMYSRYTILIDKGRRVKDGEELQEIDKDISDAERDAITARAEWDAYAGERFDSSAEVQQGSDGAGSSDRSSKDKKR